MDRAGFVRVLRVIGNNRRTQEDWEIASEAEYRARGLPEPFWENRWGGEHYHANDVTNRRKDGFAIVRAMPGGRWLTIAAIRKKTGINTSQGVMFWFHRWDGLLEKKFLKKIRSYEYRLDPARVDAAWSIVENY